MGSDRRFNYSAIGDAVDVATRIGSCCKAVGVQLLISEETARAASGFAVLETGEIALRGEAQARNLFVLVGDEAMAARREFQELEALHARLLGSLRNKNRAEAAALLHACRSLGGEQLGGLYNRLGEKAAVLAVDSVTPVEGISASGLPAHRAGR